jgi:chromosome segregation ATPase
MARFLKHKANKHTERVTIQSEQSAEMTLLHKVVDLAIPVALTLAIIVGLLWEHDEQLATEEAEWDQFFTGRKLRNAASMQKLHGELATATQNARVQQETVTFLREQQQELQANKTAAEEALTVAKADMKDLSQQATAKDHAKALAGKKLYTCEEDHGKTMAKLQTLMEEAHRLEGELGTLEKRKHRLTDILNRVGVRAGKKADVLLVEEKEIHLESEKKKHSTTTAVATGKMTTAAPLTKLQRNKQEEGAEDEVAGKEDLRTTNSDTPAKIKASLRRKGNATPNEIEAMADKLKNAWEADGHGSEEDILATHRPKNKKENSRRQKPVVTTHKPEVDLEADDV